MKRRKPVMITPSGKPWGGTVPARILHFRADDWPGDEPWERWDAWWDAAHAWADSHLPGGFQELSSLMPEVPGRPWNLAEI